jgi:hypothetical protein
MRVPELQGTIGRRLLVNFRADPDVVAPLLPAPFRPQLVRGFAVVGICLLRLEELRPVGVPRLLGQRSENAAHRVAVEWDTTDGPAHGVYINRRDSDAMLNVLAGGRVFPGAHHRSRFTVREDDHQLTVGFDSRDGSVAAMVRAQMAADLGDSRLFATLEEASGFFEAGSIGYSDGASPGALDGMELVTNSWRVEPLRVDQAVSSYFDDEDRFPPGSTELDSALVMRQVPVRWRSVGTMRPVPSGSTEPLSRTPASRL